jgi:hypothetical protein
LKIEAKTISDKLKAEKYQTQFSPIKEQIVIQKEYY